MIYFDANANARPDSGERVIIHFEVKIEQDGAELVVKTNDRGYYQVDNLPAGSYLVTPQSPPGFGTSGTSYDREVVLDGRNSRRDVDFGIMRGGLAKTPTPGIALPAPPAIAAPRTPTPLPTIPPVAIVTPLATPAPAAPDTASSPLAGPSGGPASGSSGSVSGSSAASGAAVARQQAVAAPTDTPLQVAPATATSVPTGTPAPTRTPSAMDGQLAASERARAALGSPGEPRLNSAKGPDAVLLDVTFRTAQDGSEYSDTNSGVAALAMAMDSYGFSVPTADLRSLANELDRNYDVGEQPRIDLLSRVGQTAGLRSVGLYQGARLALWTADGVREKLRAGYPVLTMLRPPNLAGPAEADREHYVLFIGYEGADLIYHDPTYADESGARRRIPSELLLQSWMDSPNSSRAAGLALGRSELGLFAVPADLKAAARSPEQALGLTPVALPTSGAAASAALLPLRPNADLSLQAVVEVPAPSPDGPLSPGAFGLPPLHPLMLAFFGVAALVAAKVVAGLIFE
ncbi:MAG: C39 family peptidase [Chloroflexi bacterium]|nr:C39 family peptidase [Chloroflexota bacterium]